MEWAFIWLMVVLKVPVVAAIWLVWWAMTAEPEPEGSDDGGTKVPEPGPPHPPSRRPRPPRRGPHGDPTPLPSPERIRTRAVTRTHAER